MTPYYQDDQVTLHHGDCRDVLAQMPPESVHAIVCDPPYELGFMGRSWDSSGVAYDVATWREAWRVLKPGGHLLAFGGSRTAHRVACAIEDAGFDIRDTITWLYGSGFPKSLDIGKAIDRAAGVTREVVGVNPLHRPRSSETVKVYNGGSGGWGVTGSRYITAPATEDARLWQGWGTALKPASEPVIWARKPFNPVPLDWRLVANVHHALAGLLWLSLSPAKRVELGSQSRNPGHDAAWCVSARVSAALGTSPDASDETATFNSPALASTSWNIARSWSAILAALSAPMTTSTTSTASNTTTALRTLNSLLAPITSQTTMPPCACLPDGPASAAPSADQSSTGAWTRWTDTLSASAPESAIEGIALAAASALAQVAEQCSGVQAAGNSADPTATTEAGERRSHASEPIIVARKPFPGTVAANVLVHGTGGINIAACRVAHTSADDLAESQAKNRHADFGSGPRENAVYGTDARARGGQGNYDGSAGRWPSNVVLSHAATEAGGDACAEGCVAGCPVADLDAQSGVTRSPAKPVTQGARRNGSGWDRPVNDRHAGQGVGYADTGGASRFFPVFRYEAKAPTSERVKVVKPVLRLRDDLTDDQRAYVLAELTRAGVDVA